MKSAKLPKCQPCGRGLFQDRLAALLKGQQYNQVPVECPAGGGWHLIPHELAKGNGR